MRADPSTPLAASRLVLSADLLDAGAQLREACREQVARGRELHLPWGLALLLADEAVRDIEPAERTRLAPDWADEQDLDVLGDALARHGLPRVTPLRVKLIARGTAGRPGYRLESQWVDAQGRPRAEPPHVEDGLVYDGSGAPARLTLGQYVLFERLQDFRSAAADRAADLLATGRVLAALPRDDPGVMLDTFLAREEYVEAGAVAPHLQPVTEGYQVRPRLAGVPARELEAHYFRSPEASLGRAVLVEARPDGGRRRVVLTERTRRSLLALRRLDVLSPTEAAHAWSDPEGVFGPDVDLSAFSDRVTGFGPPVHVFHPAVKEIEARQWWDWDVEGAVEALGSEAESLPLATRASLKAPSIRAELREAIARADERGDGLVPNPFGPGFLEVSDRLRSALDAADRLEAESVNGRLARRPRLVLQVQDNLAELVFDRSALPELVRPAEPPTPPGLLAGYALKPHQLEGLSWLVTLAEERGDAGQRWAGALLADDMGLGKTLQVLALLDVLRARGRGGPHLVVAPVTLLANWQTEARRFFGEALEPLVVVNGELLRGSPEEGARRLGRATVALAGYELMTRNELAFAGVDWDVVVLDEAQRVKNPGTQASRVARALKARFRIAMTGTPVENTLAELWSLCDWAIPGLLGSLSEFSQRFIEPLSQAETAVRRRIADEIHALLGPVYQRRMKHDVLGADLPPIEHARHDVPMSALQRSRYGHVIAGKEAGDIAVFPALQRLLALCSHPGMDGTEQALRPLEDEPFPKGHQLIHLLDDIRARSEKVLIFANRKAVQRWLQQALESRYDIRAPVINGDITGSEDRLAIVDRFTDRSGFAALVLAPRAAGVGLNITAANHVIHYTREWNPAVENQATDRAYRIGQRLPVHVHTLVVTDPAGTTVDERLAELLDDKRQLMRDFVIPLGGFELKETELMPG